jgi:nitrite reductase/ring-hydroxylating ferredoxin subunit
MFDPVAAGSARARWLTVDGLAEVDPTRPRRRSVEGSALIFASVDGQLYAYADHCPACRSGFEQPELRGSALCCAACHRRYDLTRAGVALDGGLLQLDPVPLLVQDGEVRVALEAVSA